LRKYTIGRYGTITLTRPVLRDSGSLSIASMAAAPHPRNLRRVAACAAKSGAKGSTEIPASAASGVLAALFL
jgi:hypothetical protein